MKKTIVYLALLLSVSVLALTLTTPIALSQTENVQIVNYSYHFNSKGLLVVAGEIQNNGPNIVQQVIVSGTASTAYGQEMISGDIAWASNIVPGQKAPFFMQIQSNLTSDGSWVGGIGNINLKVIQAPTTNQYQYQGVTITDEQPSTGSSGEYTVSGDLRNTGSQTANNVAVVATFYDSSGVPLTVGCSSKIANMDPNGTNTFTLTANDANQTLVGSSPIKSYALMVQVDAPLINGTAPSPTVVMGPGSGVQSTNNGNNLSPIYIVVFAVAIAVVVAVLVLFTRRRPVEISTGKPSKNKKRKRR